MKTIVIATVCNLLPMLLGSEMAETKEQELNRNLKELQTSKDAKVRVAAVQQITELAKLKADYAKKAEPEFMKALKDKDARVRAAVAYAIGAIDPENKKEVIETLTKMLTEDKDQKAIEGAAMGLGNMGTDAKEALPTLREILKKTTDKQDAKIFQMAIQSISGRKKN